MNPLYDAHGRVIPPAPAAPSGDNRLAGSTSPYLLQHAANPVAWYPWGPEALERSRREDRPILLSIGYSACHWCHVMAHESFEDPEIAGLMNENFVCIKVDREERPDIDEIYMSAVQLMTGSGGWPLTAFLTPDLKPFYGGTYFPPDDRYGRPGMKRLIPEIARIYRERREDVTAQAEELTRAVVTVTTLQSGRSGAAPGPAAAERLPGRSVFDGAVRRLLQNHDDEWGGFGPAPKFPPSMALSLLLRHLRRNPADGDARKAVTTTLDRMAQGGLYDHLGGGFARYSTDERWLVPHFEKMLYDNALLVGVYAEAREALGGAEGERYAKVILDTLSFVERELTDPAGGFHSALDADSEGEEGKFYVWTFDEIVATLGIDDATFFAGVYDVSEDGNWDGTNILWLRRPLADLAREAGIDGSNDEAVKIAEARLEPLRERLLAARSKRIRPGTDDKVLTAWNGLMISAFARAAQALDRPELALPAVRAADFLLGNVMHGGRLRRTWRQGQSHLAGYLEDYSFLAVGLIDLYETTFDLRWLVAAEDLLTTALRHFGDSSGGGFFFTADDHEELLARPRSVYDGAVPSGSSMMVEALLRLSLLLDRPEWRREAERTLSGLAESLAEAPGGHHRMLAAIDRITGDPVEIAFVGGRETTEGLRLLSAVRGTYLPNSALAWLDPAAPDAAEVERRVALVRGKTAVDGKAAAYVCRNYSCLRPATTAGELRKNLETTAPRS
jgi:uncharacterized protein YyaL (SSP411 family)